MIQSGVPIGEIARRLSFYDLSHYYRTFKKYTGVTPQQFRDTNIVVQKIRPVLIGKGVILIEESELNDQIKDNQTQERSKKKL